MLEINKYLKPSNYIRKIWYFINATIFDKLECLFFIRDTGILENLKPIFIVGAPRSGSTLLVQIMSDAFNLGSITSRHCQFFGAPIIAERLFKPLKYREMSNYHSNYGKIDSFYESSECGEFWYRFFRRYPAYVTNDDVNQTKMEYFANSIRTLSKLQNRPLLFKNLYVTLRIRPILKYVPEALFIVIRRSEVDNALSILQGRMNALGTYETWWSVPPPEVDELKKLPPEEQVIEQIRSLYSLIEKDIDDSCVDKAKVFTIEYESLCKDVNLELGRINRFLQNNGITVKTNNEVPKTFEKQKRFNINAEMKERLAEYSYKGKK